MLNQIYSFMRREDGAVTVDWVVLTAAIVALGVGIGVAMTSSATGLSADIWVYLDSLDLFN